MFEATLPVPSQGFSQYLRQIGRFDVLSREQEYELALRYKRRGDLDAARRLICANLLFVVRIAREYRHYGQSLADLVQEGNLGLMVALKKFDPEQGNRFISYAVWWIRAYIQNYIMQAWSLVKIGTTQAQKKLFYKLKKTRRALRQLTGREDVQEIAELLGVKAQEVEEMSLRMDGQDLSLDLPLGDGEDQKTHLDLLPDARCNQEELLAELEQQRQMEQAVARAVSGLNPRQQQIVRQRHLSEQPRTLREIADDWGITRERVRQLEEAALKKLRESLQQYRPGAL